MNTLKLISMYLILIGFDIIAQTKIEGKYDPVSKTFETSNKAYWVGFFENGLARIYKGGYVGLMDSTGAILCEPKYDDISKVDLKLYKISLNNKYGLLDYNGKEILAPSVDEISEFNYGFSIYFSNDSRHYGILKNDGTFLTEAKYELLKYRNGIGFLFRENDSIGIINYNGEKVLEYQEDTFYKDFKDYTIRIENGTTIHLFRKLQSLYVEHAAELLNFVEGHFITFKQVGDCYKFGFMDKDFRTVIAPKYDWVEEFKNGYAIVSIEEKWGVIDKKGEIVIPIKYSFIKQAYKNRFIVSLNDKYGVLNSKNMIVLPIKYNSLFGLDNNLYATHKNKKWGVINEIGKQILPYKFDGIDNEIATILTSKTPIHTSIPREIMKGEIYKYNKDGKIEKTSLSFNISLENNEVLISEVETFFENPKKFLPNYPVSHLVNYLEFKKVIKDHKFIFIRKLPNSYYMIKTINDSVFNISNLSRYTLDFNQYKYGVIKQNEKIIIPLVYNELYPNEIINGHFNTMDYHFENLFVSILNNKKGVIDLNNFTVIPFDEYENILIGSGIILTSKRNKGNELKYAVFDFFGKELIPFGFSEIRITKQGALEKKEGSNWCLIDKKGNKINIEE